jgi:putative PIN family toxin of toxin-antitoxin system
MANSLKIIFDVNIWVSALISQRMSQQIQAVILQDNVEVIACHQLLLELQQTLKKPKLQKYISSKRADFAMELVQQSTTLIHSNSIVKFCRDDKDDYLLALAKDAEADFLITGDNDLLVLKTFDKTQIIMLSELIL